VPAVAILGAGSIGSAVAYRLSQRARVGDILLVDESVDAAAGKALDMRQAGPIDRTDAALSAAPDVLAAAGASVVVVADEIRGGEWHGDRGLPVMERLLRAGCRSPIVFAGPQQLWLMEACFRELKIKPARLVGTAPAAMVSAARALAGLELNLTGIDLALVGRPPRFVVGWSAATVGGSLVSSRVPPHQLLALSASLATLWPPGPQAIAAATAPIVEALLSGSRRLHHAATVIDGDLGARGKAVMLPLEIGIGGIVRHVMPSLSAQEQTDLMNAIADS
jgi:malate dehydrogenase